MGKQGTTLEIILGSTPPALWEIEQAIVFDWYDGPREGVCALSTPRCCFHFQIIAENRHNDCAHYNLSEMPLDSVEQLMLILAELGPKAKPIWIPLWRFKDQAAQIEAEQAVDRLLALKKPTTLIMATNDMRRFKGCWLGIR